MPEVDYRDCLDLAGEIAERIEPSDGSSPYEGDDLISDCIIPAILPTIRELLTLREQVAKLQAFKTWVHDYLDQHGVPHHPPGTHGAEGCRIGDRMDWLMAKLETATRK